MIHPRLLSSRQTLSHQLAPIPLTQPPRFLLHLRTLPNPTRFAHTLSQDHTAYEIHTPSSSSSSSSRNPPSKERRPRPRQNWNTPSSSGGQPSPLWRSSKSKANRTSTSVVVPPQLVDFRDALARKDLDRLWSAWSELRQRGLNLGRTLSETDQRRLHQLVLQTFAPTPHRSHHERIHGRSLGVGTARPPEWEQRCLEWAIESTKTSRDYHTAEWIKLEASLERWDNVKRIFAEFVQSRKAIPSASLALPTPRGQDGSDLLGATGHPIRFSLDRPPAGNPNDVSDIFLYMVLAHTASGDSSGMLEIMANVEPSGSYVRLFLDPQRARSLFSQVLPPGSADHDGLLEESLRWTLDAELALGLGTGSDASLRRILRLLGGLFSQGKSDLCWGLFRAALAAMSGPQSWLPIIEGPSSGKDSEAKGGGGWTESCWSVCLSNFIALGQEKRAAAVWSSIHALGLKPTARIWNGLLTGYSQTNNFEAAQRTWNEMRQRSEESGAKEAKIVDAVSYTTMISICFKARRPDDAMHLFAEMRSKSELLEPAEGQGSIASSRPDREGGLVASLENDRNAPESKADHRKGRQVPTETLNAVIHGLFTNGWYSEARLLLERMEREGIRPTIGTINTLMRAHGRIGDFAGLAHSIRMIGRMGLEPDVVTFTTILDALLRKAGGSSAQEVVVKTLKMMETMGVQPNAVTYTAMIKACLSGASTDQVVEFEEGEGEEKGVRTKVRGDPSTTLSNHLSELKFQDNPSSSSSSSNPCRIDAGLMLLDKMIQSGKQPTEVTYTALIAAVLANPSSIQLLHSQSKIPPHYMVPPQPLVQLGEERETMEELVRIRPDLSLALILLERMNDSPTLHPNRKTYHYLLEGLLRPGSPDSAFARGLSLLDEMLPPVTLQGQTSPTSRILSAVTCRLCRKRPSTNQTKWIPTNESTWFIVLHHLIERVESIRPPKIQDRIALTEILRILTDPTSPIVKEQTPSLTRLVEKARRTIGKV
ncbi:hypothetical protein IE53DRAFT_413258 [Violaceomyces palustris]|uniref:Uncharacterized protein n=1 Tax=Violaceomyces palustris TaxID=1673888 RepID=A0ACD0NMW0_9BASI|nr:hypothetical protein IE53DRAFT_413258 [Violaceomyces palustris]